MFSKRRHQGERCLSRESFILDIKGAIPVLVGILGFGTALSLLASVRLVWVDFVDLVSGFGIACCIPWVPLYYDRYRYFEEW
jgi:hypothetical protein